MTFYRNSDPIRKVLLKLININGCDRRYEKRSPDAIESLLTTTDIVLKSTDVWCRNHLPAGANLVGGPDSFQASPQVVRQRSQVMESSPKKGCDSNMQCAVPLGSLPSILREMY